MEETTTNRINLGIEYDEGTFHFTIPFADDEVVIISSDSFQNGLRHAMYYADPVLFASAFENYFEWTEKHKTSLQEKL